MFHKNVLWIVYDPQKWQVLEQVVRSSKSALPEGKSRVYLDTSVAQWDVYDPYSSNSWCSYIQVCLLAQWDAYVPYSSNIWLLTWPFQKEETSVTQWHVYDPYSSNIIWSSYIQKCLLAQWDAYIPYSSNLWLVT